MSAKVTGAVWELEMPAAQRMVLLAMADHADHDGNNVFPSVPLVAWKTGYSIRQVQRILRELTDCGVLVEVSVIKGKTTRYRIDISAGIRKPEYQHPAKKGRQNVTSTPDKMSPPENVTPDKMTPPPMTSCQGRGDIAMSPESSINQELELNSIAAAAAPDASQPSSSQTTSLPAESSATSDSHANDDLPDGYTRTADGRLFVRADLVEDDAPVTAYPCTAQDINALIGAWWDWVPKRPTKRGKILPSSQHFANKANREYAESLVQRGVTPGDFIEFLGDVRYNPENTRHDIRDEETTFCYVAAAVEDFAAADRSENVYTPHCPRIVHRRPGVNVNLGELAGVSGPELYHRLTDHPDLLVEFPPPFISVHELQPEDDATAEDWSHEWTEAELEAEIPL